MDPPISKGQCGSVTSLVPYPEKKKYPAAAFGGKDGIVISIYMRGLSPESARFLTINFSSTPNLSVDTTDQNLRVGVNPNLGQWCLLFRSSPTAV